MWQKIIKLLEKINTLVQSIQYIYYILPTIVVAVFEFCGGRMISEYIYFISIFIVGICAFCVTVKFIGHKLSLKKHSNNFITFKEAVDYCIDFKEDTGIYIDIVNPTKKLSHDYYSLLYAHLGPITMVDTELYILLHLIKQNEITLYGQRTETVKNIRPIHLGKIDKNVYLNVKNWNQDLSSLYDNDKLLYTNLCIKQKDINSLIERGKLQKEHVIQSMLKNN